VIRRTFQLVPGVGPWREKDLWAQGLPDWDALRARGRAVLGAPLLDDLGRAVDRAEAALERGDLAALAALLPVREHWRLWPLVRERVLCLDVEADGAADRLLPTVVGVLDPDGLHAFVAGRNLDALPARLAAHPFWVTFNGTCFDLPVLRRAFPELPAPELHLDLRGITRRMGLGGGLKAIEDRIGIARPPHLRGTGGREAISLWRAYRNSGEVDVLRTLVEYNLYDAFQLRAVGDHAFNAGASRLHWPDRVLPWERGEMLYDLSRLLLSLTATDADLAAVERARSLAELEG
jgi:uncharacterized protein